VADLVFPWFMWIMGVSLAISAYSKINKASSSRWELVKHVLKRSAILFFLGEYHNVDGNWLAINRKMK